MNEENRVQSAELKQFVIDKVEDLKARDIAVLDVSEQSNITDFMVVCSGTSKTHVKAIAENVVLEAKRANLHIHGVEGRDSSEWVLVDLGDVIVHVMQDQTRDFYQLEKLWSEKPE
jgi:ribosome-associated protein